ncbi:adenylyl-sulfate kinase [Falsibacillus albus]|uniref:Adenylyl-sulfate kinase n=1 Tax=Falsibacillus albus TaxID=2478915 RepID=A0A3L7JYK6_9BACI|nr:adenylyl-sulfate kinase [Falsibacillus albus]RLQ95887.1 adenylyl-sulfate kinase [Falsibacillus albus]
MDSNIAWHQTAITKEQRRKKNHHHSFVLWFTGLSGSGKSTLANAVAAQLFEKGINHYILDGDNIRHGLNRDLSFSDEDRKENIRRIAEVSKLFVDSGTVVLTAFISPFIQDRRKAKELLDDNEFLEVFVDCPLKECEERDPKGLYQKARNGEIPQFTGIDSPYEVPLNPDLVIKTDQLSLRDSAGAVIALLKQKKFL